jgi:hypothetical protein
VSTVHPAAEAVQHPGSPPPGRSRLTGASLLLAPRYTVIGLLRLYQLTLSPLLGPVCRFAPSCSSYAVEAVRIHGVVRGGWLSGRRLARCHPWNPGGWDPVPPGKKPRVAHPSPTTAR